MESWSRRLLGQEKEPSLMDEIGEQCSLSLKQRIIGFLICLGLGLFFCIFSIFFIASIVLNPSAFAVPYTLGNILAVCATAFLVGPCRQLKNMFSPVRIIATLIFIGAMVLTLVAAFVLKSQLLVLLAVVIQFCALVWYCLSYIPYARACAKNIFSGIVSV